MNTKGLSVAGIKNDLLHLEVSRQGGHFTRLDANLGDLGWQPVLARSEDKPYIKKLAGTEEEFVSGGNWPTLGARTIGQNGEPGFIPWKGENLPCGADEQFLSEFAIHHIPCRRPWEVKKRGGELHSCFTHSNPDEKLPQTFPFAFTLDKRYRLEGPRLHCTTVYTNTGERVAPATFGDHFFWMKSIKGSTGMPKFRFHASGVYPKENDILLPKGPIRAVDSTLDFKDGKVVDVGLDHCFQLNGDRLAHEPRFIVTWRTPEGRQITAKVTMSVEYGWVVVFSPADGECGALFNGTVAGEIQTGVSNPFYQHEVAKVEDTGLVELPAGEALKASWCIEITTE